MKKLLVLVMVMAMIVTSAMVVLAEEVDEEAFVTNMDEETYLEVRLAQIEAALADGTITVEQADLLREHVMTVAEEGSFGAGPYNGTKGDGSAACILGEDTNLGIFRSESAGQRNGSGNGVALQSGDGYGSGNRGNGKISGGRGNRGGAMGSGSGLGYNYDGECIVD